MKSYLGDGVYAEHLPDAGELHLTTEDGIRTTNRIVFDDDVLRAFEEFVRTIRRRRRNVQGDQP